ncbi:hypothetical protein HYZ70_00525 [Candidatus Curtissbacteria bacterium]|nr:hypothetical protein [Candidatus Curtissbacteria bacterium]
MAIEKYGGNRSSLRTAEVPPNRKWTLEIVSGAVYALREAGEPINAKYIEVNHRLLYKAIRANYGWKTIITFLGLDPQAEAANGRSYDRYNKNLR